MIVVLGSRRDAVAAELVAAWPGAGLCSAEDLVSPGWCWRLRAAGPRRWVVQGCVVDDDDVSGVFLRRSAVYPEELEGIHPEDRAYMAAEAQALLSAVLARTGARVAQPLHRGAFGEEALRGEWLAAGARTAGVVLTPFVSSRREPNAPRIWVEVVAGATCVGGATQRGERARRLTKALGLPWAAVAFDGRGRVLGVSVTRAPGPVARQALNEWLAAPRRRKR